MSYKKLEIWMEARSLSIMIHETKSLTDKALYDTIHGKLEVVGRPEVEQFLAICPEEP